MDDFLIYDAKVAVLIAVFYMFYRLMLARETFHRVNRIVLLLTAVASFVLPLCVITMHETVIMDNGLNGLDGLNSLVTDSELREISEPHSAETPLWQRVLPVLFIIGMVATLGHTLLSVLKVIRLIHRSEQHPQDDGTIICVTGNADLAPFSWLRYIVMNRSDYEQADAAILAHERGHIRLRHSWDLLLVDTLTALQWFNPAMWMLRSDLRAIHEYEADGAVLSLGINARQYQYLLITKAAGIGGYSIANGISHSTLKNRINMMLHKKSRRSHLLKLLALIPIVGAALALNAKTVTDVVYANNDTEASEVPSIESMIMEAMAESEDISFRVVFMPEGAPIEGVPVEVIDKGKTIQKTETVDMGEVSVNAPIGSTVRFTLVDKVKDVKVTKELLAKSAKGTITVAFNQSGGEIVESDGETFMAEGTVYDNDADGQSPIIGAVVRNTRTQKGVVTDREGRFSIEAASGDQLVFSYAGFEPFTLGASKVFSENGSKYIVPLRHVDSNKVYDVVEEMPQFPGGVAAMMPYIARSLRYPKEAEQNGIQGRVIATFIVEKDGSISDAHVVKPIDPALDAEALRVVNAMPKWEPGKQGGQPMRVKYTIPVTFRLDNGAPIPPMAEQSLSQIAEAVVMGHQENHASGKSGIDPEKTSIIIDGNAVDIEALNTIDPKTIEHIEVLKSKESLEKLGIQGKQSAIIITTKKQ